MADAQGLDEGLVQVYFLGELLQVENELVRAAQLGSAEVEQRVLRVFGDAREVETGAVFLGGCVAAHHSAGHDLAVPLLVVGGHHLHPPREVLVLALENGLAE